MLAHKKTEVKTSVLIYLRLGTYYSLIAVNSVDAISFPFLL